MALPSSIRVALIVGVAMVSAATDVKIAGSRFQPRKMIAANFFPLEDQPT